MDGDSVLKITVHLFHFYIMFKIYSFSFLQLISINYNIAFCQPTNKTIEVSLVEKFVINDTESQSDEFIFGEPETIFTDSERNIYITDSKAMKIWVFDDTGNYKTSIGRRGRGPGEFLSLDFAFINNKDEIFAPDPPQFRVTKFNTDGEVLNTVSTSRSQDINFFKEVILLENEQFLILFYKEGKGKFAKYSREGLFHIWDANFQNEIANYGKFEQLGFTEPSFGRRFIRTRVGSMAQLQNGNLLLAPFLYQGKLLSYTKKQKGWEFDRSFEGFRSNQPSWVSLDENDPEAGSIHTYGMKPVYGKVNILSSGIFTLNNDYLVHFSIRKDTHPDSKVWEFGVELFDMEQKFLGYYPLETLDNLYTTSDPLVQWKDDEGRFYMLDQEEGVSVVRVFTLDI